MNLQHLSAFLWLRWRLLVNQWRRGGRLNAALMILLVVGAIATAVPLFAGTLWLGLHAIPRARPIHLLIVWDALVLAFLLFWSMGLVSELQRSEPLALSKFLHLPVSAGEAFLINYLSSLLSLSLIVFAPVMLAFALALVLAKGPAMLPSLAGLGAFLLMVTALTYQFRGWLAALMSNPRRRRTIVVLATGFFVLVTQLPNLVNLYAPWGRRQVEQVKAIQEELDRQVREGEAKGANDRENGVRQEAVARRVARLNEESRENVDRWKAVARMANMLLPIGWLPLGVMSAAEGNVLPSLLGLAGMTLIGVGSLRWAHRSTIRLYQGEPTNQKPQAASAAHEPRAANAGRKTLLVEAKLPGLSETVSAVALATFRSLLRAPEAKMMLLSSGIMMLVFGSMALRGGRGAPEWSRPLTGIMAMAIVLLSQSSVMANQFGLDRDGFRVFVLSPARRRDILLGKNLAFGPVISAIVLILLTLLQVFQPMKPDHFLAMVPQFIAMYLLYCIFTNMLSIFAPVYVPGGSLRPSNPSLSTVLLQLVTLMILLPLAQALTLIPLGAELLMELLGEPPRWPVFLPLSLAQCALVVLLYLACLRWQGRLLHEREQGILERVTAKAT